MNKLAIILDTFSERNEKWCQEQKHFYFLPLQIEIDNETHKCGIKDDSGIKEHGEAMAKAKSVKTSMPTPNDMETIFQDLSNKYEQVIYLSIGSPVSGTNKAATVFAQEYENVHVLNNLLVGLQFEILGKKLTTMAEEGKDFSTIKAFADQYIEEDNETYIIPKDVDAFIKSGRLGRALGMLLNRVKAVPVVAYDNFSQLSKKMIKRSWKKAVSYALQKVINTVKESKTPLTIQITHGFDADLKDFAVSELAKVDIIPHVEHASPLVMANTGSGAMSIGAIKKL